MESVGANKESQLFRKPDRDHAHPASTTERKPAKGAYCEPDVKGGAAKLACLHFVDFLHDDGSIYSGHDFHGVLFQRVKFKKGRCI
jgi:hypothetical protein